MELGYFSLCEGFADWGVNGLVKSWSWGGMGIICYGLFSFLFFLIVFVLLPREEEDSSTAIYCLC